MNTVLVPTLSMHQRSCMRGPWCMVAWSWRDNDSVKYPSVTRYTRIVADQFHRMTFRFGNVERPPMHPSMFRLVDSHALLLQAQFLRLEVRQFDLEGDVVYRRHGRVQTGITGL